MKIFCLIFWGIMMAIAPKGFSQIYELSGRVKVSLVYIAKNTV